MHKVWVPNKNNKPAMICEKKNYANRRRSKEALKRANNRREFKGGHVYFCEECDQWHITKVSRQASRLIERGIRYSK